MKISMLADFKVLKNENGFFVPMKHDKIEGVSVGGYSFIVAGKTIPFDWDAFVGNRAEADGRFVFETGYGFAFNDFEIPDYWDDEYKEMGLRREDISAEFLASATEINEFFVYFEDKDASSDECYAGSVEDNANPQAKYKIKLLKVVFTDVDTDRMYPVKRNVLEAFNKGERGRAPLETLIADSFNKQVGNHLKEHETTVRQPTVDDREI